MKVNLKINLDGEEKLDLSVKGIKNDNTIKYLENDISVLITTFKNKIIIERKHPDYQVNLNLELNKDTLSTYSFTNGFKTFSLHTSTKKLEISENRIYAKYILEDNEFIFTLEVI